MALSKVYTDMIIGLEDVGGGTGSNALFSDFFVGDGTASTFTVSVEPASKNNTQVYIDGVYQSKVNYEVEGSDIVLSEAPGAGREIEIVVAYAYEFGYGDFVKKEGDLMTGKLVIDDDLDVSNNINTNTMTFDDDINISVGGVKWLTGEGDPENVVIASVGSLYTDTTATNDSILFVKTSGNDATGWQQAGSGNVDPGDGTNAITTDTFTGDGIETVFTLSEEPASKDNTQVYISGVYQYKSNYSVSGRSLTFTTAPPKDQTVEVVMALVVSVDDAGGGMFKGNDGTVGSGVGDIFRINAQVLNTSVTITGTENAVCGGPLEIATDVILTVEDGGNLSIV